MLVHSKPLSIPSNPPSLLQGTQAAIKVPNLEDKNTNNKRHIAKPLPPPLRNPPKILADLLPAPWPITLNGSFKAAHNQGEREVHRILGIIGILPPGSRLFYARITFHVSCPLISSFLSHTILPSRTQFFPSDTAIRGDPITSKEHVTHLSVSIDTRLHDTRKTAGLLRCFAGLPSLQAGGYRDRVVL